MTESSVESSIQLQNTIEILKKNIEQYVEVAFANSLSIEDIVINDLLMRHFPAVFIFTLDTGRLHEETILLIDAIRRRYNKQIAVFYPNDQHIEKFVLEHGINAFYDNIEYRKQCCFIRKVEPLKRALKGKKAWITGIRKDQSVTRKDLEIVEWDSNNHLYKINPLLHWTEKQVWEYVNFHRLPYNQLYDKKFASIGCAPCTRAIAAGEDVRSGRWWWENPDTKECGLHIQSIRR